MYFHKKNMKYLTLITLGVSLLFFTAGCSKKDINNPDSQTTPKAEFVINGISDITLSEGVGIMALEVTHVSGEQQIVNLSLIGLPEGITADFSATSGTPTFNTNVTLSSDGIVDGSFPVKLLASNNATSKEYTFAIHTSRDLNCIDFITGTYSYRYIACFDYRNHDISIVEKPGGEPGQIEIAYLISNTTNRPDIIFYAEVNCTQQTITIPEQINSIGRAMRGEGKFGAAYMGMPYVSLAFTTTDDNGDIIECNAYISH